MVDFIRSLFESALKTNDSLEFAVITGCLRISRESIFTGLNNLEIISILNKYYSEHFGFIHQEVSKMLQDYNLSSKETLVQEWYDGYTFGDVKVYNPWSVIKIVKDLYKDKNTLPSSYWAITSSNSIIRSLVEKADLTTREEIEKLIAGETIEKPIHEDITYDEIYIEETPTPNVVGVSDSHKKQVFGSLLMDNLWNFMFFTGYLKKVDQRMDNDDTILVTLKIPNKEVKYIFKNKILDWFNEKIKVKDLSILYSAIIDGNVEIFQKELRKLLRESISFNDAYENFYHGFVVGVLMNMSDYIIRSNFKEAPRQENEVGFHTKLDATLSVQCQGGTGRIDVYIKSPSVLERAVILEFKVAENIKQLDKKRDEAIAQNKDKEYDMELRNEGYEDIIEYGIAFYKKDCMIKINN